MRRLSLSILLLIISTGVFSATPSFNCKKATGYAEKTICSSDELASLDRKLDAMFFELVKVSELPDEFKKVQTDWLRSRNTCKTEECLRKMYLNRIEALMKYTSAYARERSRRGDRINQCNGSYYIRAWAQARNPGQVKIKVGEVALRENSSDYVYEVYSNCISRSDEKVKNPCFTEIVETNKASGQCYKVVARNLAGSMNAGTIDEVLILNKLPGYLQSPADGAESYMNGYRYIKTINKYPCRHEYIENKYNVNGNFSKEEIFYGYSAHSRQYEFMAKTETRYCQLFERKR